MKKVKTYELSDLGLAQALLDSKVSKQKKVNDITTLALVLVFLGLGWMSKEFLLLYVTGKGIDFITNLIL